MRYLLILICCLIPFLSYASGPSVLVQGTAAGTTQLRLSTVDGTALIDGDGTVPCTSFIGEKLEIIDSAGKKISGFVKAAGSGESFGSELTINGDMSIGDPPSDWNKGGNQSLASETGSGNYNTSPSMLVTGNGWSKNTAVSVAIGGLFKASIYLKVGTCTSINPYLDFGSGIVQVFAGAKSPISITQYSWYGNSKTINSCAVSFNITASDNTKTAYIDDASVKQVLTPSSTGCTIVSTKGGTTYNWNIKETGFDSNSATFTYRILSTNIPGQQIASGTVSSSDVKLATVDGGAMVEITGVDLSPYAGDDAGGPVTIINPKSTSAATMTTNKYLLALYDSSGRVATGYVGAAGGGETLSGVELVTNGTFDSDTNGWTPYTGTNIASVAGGETGNALQIEHVSGGVTGYAWCYRSVTTGIGKCYKLSWYAKDGTDTNKPVHVYGFGNTISNLAYSLITTSGSWVQSIGYGTAQITSYPIRIQSGGTATIGNTLLYDTVSLQQVTDIATTGVHLHSTPNATDRKMSLKTTGFDPNAVTSYKIYRVY